MKNSADLGGCYPPRPSASVDNILLYLENSSYPTKPHSIIAKYSKVLRDNGNKNNQDQSVYSLLYIGSKSIT